MVLVLSRAIEQLAQEADEDQRRQVVTDMREVRTMIAEWGAGLPGELPEEFR